MRSALMAAALWLAACSPKEFHCVGDQECVGSDGKFGLCIETHCAFADDGCTGKLRFDDTAGSQASVCVTPDQVFAHLDAGVKGPDAPAATTPDAPVAKPDGPLPDAPITMPDAAAPDAPLGG
jgi:hypothetical protein